MRLLVSAKQPASKDRRDWYPYYAGFTERFVESVLEQDLDRATLVLDPWSGSGTTSATCARHGVQSVGIDVNPALTVIAKARLTPRSLRDSLLPLGVQILDAAFSLSPDVSASDPLKPWLRSDAAARVRAIQDAIHLFLTTEEQRSGPTNMLTATDHLPQLACFYYCALFATVRGLLKPFGTTNPMWMIQPVTPRHRVAPRWTRLSESFMASVEYLRDRLAVDDKYTTEGYPEFYTASASDLPFAADRFDAALTSPPYATRLDYVIGTLPELAVLGASSEAVKSLRKRSTGTPVVERDEDATGGELESAYGSRLLERIRMHPSKGSSSYYWPWMRKYLLDLQAGLVETSRTVCSDGTICVVVQDSYYKESRIDLQRIVVELLADRGRTLVSRRDYRVKTLRSGARGHAARRKNTESLLVFN